MPQLVYEPPPDHPLIHQAIWNKLLDVGMRKIKLQVGSSSRHGVSPCWTAGLSPWIELFIYLPFGLSLQIQPCLLLEGYLASGMWRGKKRAGMGAAQHKPPHSRWMWSLTNDMSCRRSAWTQQPHHPQLCPVTGCNECGHGKLSREESGYRPAPGCTAYPSQSAHAHLHASLLGHEAVIWGAVQE